MTHESVYPLFVKLNSKDIQIGVAKIDFGYDTAVYAFHAKYKVILKEVKVNFNKDSIIGTVVGHWDN